MSKASVSASAAFVVIAEFRVKPGAMDAFLSAASDDASHSVADERGCRQFDVVRPEDEENAVVFYDVYDSREAFDHHLTTSHLKRFQAAFPALVIEERPVRFASRQHPDG